jgi:hypothetical protein
MLSVFLLVRGRWVGDEGRGDEGCWEREGEGEREVKEERKHTHKKIPGICCHLLSGTATTNP